MTDKSAALVAIEDFVLQEAKYTQAKEAYQSARKAVLALVPHEIGEFEVKEGVFTLNVKYPEKAEWDNESLDAKYGDDKPLYVKTSYSIDLRLLRRLSPDEQDELKGCYELKPGTPVINVETA